MTPDEKFEAITALAEEYDSCTRCGLCTPTGRTRASVPFGEGDPNARLMIIGEAAGEKEDLTGLPFQGRSGKLLDKFLNSFRLTRDEVFITNVVLCRPTEDTDPDENRTPSKEEIAACQPRLHRVIEIVDPYVVLLLGSTALRALADTKKSITAIANDHVVRPLTVVTQGRFMPVRRLGYATFHPSYLLRKDSTEQGGDMHKAYLTWQKAVRAADQFGYLYFGEPLPPRGEDE